LQDEILKDRCFDKKKEGGKERKEARKRSGGQKGGENAFKY
jgi:hypothetical protein